MTMNDRKQHLERIGNLIKTFADPCDGIIYHYTSAQGFQGIIESSELWLTNIEFVNDTTECKALKDEAGIKDLLNDDDFNRYVKKWLKLFLEDESGKNLYIASFSKVPNSLEQWRAYGNFCIGFDAQKLRRDGFHLFECVYDKEAIKEWIVEKARAEEWELSEPDRTYSYVRNDGPPAIVYDDARGPAAFRLISNASVKFKNKCYENEKEVRLFAESNHDWSSFPKSGASLFGKNASIYFRFHPMYKLPVPYIKFFIPSQIEECNSVENYEGKTECQIKEEKREKEKNQKRALLPIKEIWLGPSPRKEETKLACEILLQEKGYKDFQITVSEIPYRGF